MKTLASILLLVSCSAFAQTVVLRNPTFQGKPILSHTAQNGGRHNPNATMSAHIVCRLHGYDRAVMSAGRATFETQVVARANTQIFLPASLVSDGNDYLGLIGANDDFPYNQSVGLDNRKTPQFVTVRRVHQCAEISACRGFHPDQFFTMGFELDTRHPYVQACYNWGTRDREQALVFSSVTCQNVPSWRADFRRSLNTFHRESSDRLRVQSGTSAELGISLADPVRTCAQPRISRMQSGSVAVAEVGTCGYQPFDPRTNPLRAGPVSIFGDSLIGYLISTGRFREGARRGPECVQDIYRKYTNTVVRAEYELGGLVDRMAKPFCVSGVSAVTTRQTADGISCEFQAEAKDFLQVPTTLRVSLGEENGGADPTARCEEIAACFQHDELSCETANFCPAPGTVSRGQ